MKIFVQSAVVAQIKEWAEADLLDGVVLSPIDLATDDPSANVVDRLAEIAVDFGVPVCVPVAAINGADIYREGRDIARASEHAVVQIPFVEDAVSPIRKLVADGVKVCATHIYSGAQAFIAAKLGASMVAIDVRDIDAQGRPSGEAVAQIRAVIDKIHDRHLAGQLLHAADVIGVEMRNEYRIDRIAVDRKLVHRDERGCAAIDQCVDLPADQMEAGIETSA